MLVLVAVAASASASAEETRAVLAVGVLPQFTQSLGTATVPSEVYRFELLRRIGRRWWAAPDLAVRADFAILGAALHRDLWVSAEREWRLSFGMEYVLPLSQTEDLFERFKGERSSTLDRLQLRLALGQSFQLEKGGPALRVESGLHLMLPGSVLSVLEAVDDPISAGEGFWFYELRAGLVFRGGDD